MPQPVAHFEVSAKNATAQREFYTSVFDWDVTVHEQANYMMLGTREGETGIDGGLFQNDEGRSRVTVCEVDDLAACLDKAASHGATPTMRPT